MPQNRHRPVLPRRRDHGYERRAADGQAAVEVGRHIIERQRETAGERASRIDQDGVRTGRRQHRHVEEPAAIPTRQRRSRWRAPRRALRNVGRACTQLFAYRSSTMKLFCAATKSNFPLAGTTLSIVPFTM
jgi:hypothetical protein